MCKTSQATRQMTESLNFNGIDAVGYHYSHASGVFSYSSAPTGTSVDVPLFTFVSLICLW